MSLMANPAINMLSHPGQALAHSCNAGFWPCNRRAQCDGRGKHTVSVASIHRSRAAWCDALRQTPVVPRVHDSYKPSLSTCSASRRLVSSAHSLSHQAFPRTRESGAVSAYSSGRLCRSGAPMVRVVYDYIEACWSFHPHSLRPTQPAADAVASPVWWPISSFECRCAGALATVR
jgi:hypothetical protein